MSVQSVFFIEVEGVNVTSNFTADATDISVTDSSGETADTASITVDDHEGHIALPPEGARIVIGLGFGVPVVIFEGFVEKVTSNFNRGGGLSLSITCKSADTVKGKTKEQAERHKDDATLEDVAKEWGEAADLEVFVHADLASVERPYWSMTNESFPAWGERTAKELGATFKIIGGRATFTPRSAGVSASGKPLVPILATRPGNLISGTIEPVLGRPQYAKFRARRFDREKGEHEADEESATYTTQSGATFTSRYVGADKKRTEAKTKSDEKESDRERGGGSVEIDGNPAAQAEAPCIVSGVRAGVDGAYRIDSVTHKRTRGGGYTCSLSLKQPKDGAGTDNR